MPLSQRWLIIAILLLTILSIQRDVDTRFPSSFGLVDARGDSGQKQRILKVLLKGGEVVKCEARGFEIIYMTNAAPSSTIIIFL